MTRKFAYLTLALGVAITPLSAAQLDLTTDNSSATTASGGLIYQIDPAGAQGTGVLDSFLRIQANGTESGYNSDLSVSDFVYDEKAGNFTESITLGEIPILNCTQIIAFTGGVCGGASLYREFILDINQTPNNEIFDLFALELYGSPGLDQTMTLSPTGLLWDLGGDTVLLNYGLDSGSGQGDYVFYIPNTAFAGLADTDNIILFSAFATNPTYTSDDGFEEWAVRLCDVGTCDDPDLPEVPEPSSMLLFGGGLLGLAFWRKRKNS